jgi:ankyrin repeat protein
MSNASTSDLSFRFAAAYLLCAHGTTGSGAVGRGLQSEDAVEVFARSCGSVCNKQPLHTPFLLYHFLTIFDKDEKSSSEELITAAERGNTAEIKELLEAETDVNCRQVNNWTPLHLAAGNGHTEAARMLIEFKVSVCNKPPTHSLRSMWMRWTMPVRRHCTSPSNTKRTR